MGTSGVSFSSHLACQSMCLHENISAWMIGYLFIIHTKSLYDLALALLNITLLVPQTNVLIVSGESGTIVIDVFTMSVLVNIVPTFCM